MSGRTPRIGAAICTLGSLLAACTARGPAEAAPSGEVSHGDLVTGGVSPNENLAVPPGNHSDANITPVTPYPTGAPDKRW
jgi:hypothetical protein